jgi:hypothetical protein
MTEELFDNGIDGTEWDKQDDYTLMLIAEERSMYNDHVIFHGNGVVISLPNDYKSMCYNIETTKYAAWLSYREDNTLAIFTKKDHIWTEVFKAPITGSLERFCECDVENRKIISANETAVEAFFDRLIKLKAFL